MKQLFAVLFLPISTVFVPGSTDDADALKPGTCCVDDSVSLIPAYLKVSEALVTDDLQSAIDAAEDLGLWAECSNEEHLDESVADLERSRNLTEARIAFREISLEVIQLTRWIPGHHVMTCPMADADWIQIESEVSNPYYGSTMVRCGKIKESIGM